MTQSTLVEHIPTGNPDSYDFENIIPKSFINETTRESLCGIDDRTKIIDTTVMPYKAVCKLYMRTKTGLNYIGSGWLVSPTKLITAGHCVYDHDEEGWMDSIIVVPGKSGHEEPFGRYKAEAFYATEEWINARSKRFDMGAIRLESSVIHSDFLTPQITDSNEAIVCGYPGDRDNGIFQYSMRDMIRKANGMFYYQIDTFGGQSGCPVLINSTAAIGIHNYGGCDNSASDLDEAFLTQIENW